MKKLKEIIQSSVSKIWEMTPSVLGVRYKFIYKIIKKSTKQVQMYYVF